MIRRRDILQAAEQGFLELQNTMATTTIPKGGACVWDYITGGVGGFAVTQPTSSTLALFCGLADEDIAPQAFGRVQIRGLQTVGLVINDTTNDLAVGDLLIPVAGQFYLARSGAGATVPGLAISGDTYTHNAVQVVTTKKVHLPFR